MENYQVVQAHIDELCEELSSLLASELAAGNTIVETWKGNWPRENCLYIMLANPFRRKHRLPNGLVLVEVNDPHYWKAEIVCERTNHALACQYKSR